MIEQDETPLSAPDGPEIEVYRTHLGRPRPNFAVEFGLEMRVAAESGDRKAKRLWIDRRMEAERGAAAVLRDQLDGRRARLARGRKT